jgi:hypothetical protein
VIGRRLFVAMTTRTKSPAALSIVLRDHGFVGRVVEPDDPD